MTRTREWTYPTTALGLFALLALLPAAAAGAQGGDGDGDSDSDTPRFEESIDVTGSQAERTATVTVVTREEMQEQHASVAFDALDKKPGLNLVRRLGLTGAGLSRLTIRGLGAAGPAGLAVFVDGRPDSSITFAHPTPSAHGLGDAERIEVIHGPSPVLHGSGKTGVINIRSVEPGAGLSGHLQISGGSHDTTENFARVAYGWDRGYVRVGGTYRYTDGHNPSSDARVSAVNLRAGFALSERWKLTLGAGVNDDHFNVFGPFSVPGPFGNPGTTELDLRQTVADVKLDGRFERVHTSLQLWLDQLDPESQNTRAGVARAEVEERGVRFKASLLPASEHTLILGVDVLEGEATNVPGLPPGLSRRTEEIDEVGPYVWGERRLSSRAALNGGLRFTDHSAYGSDVSGEAGLLFFPGDDPESRDTTVRLRATRGFQSPTLQQLFGVFLGGERGLANDRLEPETLDQYEVGINRRAGRWQLDAVVFLQESDNLIQRVGPSLRNAGEISHPGVELLATFLARDDWRFSFGVAHVDLETNIVRVPESTFDFGFVHRRDLRRPDDFEIALDARYARDVRDQPGPPGVFVELDDYLVADLKLRYFYRDAAHFFLAADNVTDEDYQTVSGIPMPGATVYAGWVTDF